MTKLPVLVGPPGHEQVPPLPAPHPDTDVRRRPRRAFPEGARKATRSIAEALFSTDGSLPDAARLDELVDDFSDFYGRAQGNARLVLRLSLLVLMWVAPLFAFRPLPLSSLPLALRAHALEKLEASPLGPAALAVKAMLCVLWFEQAQTQRETNTVPTCHGAGQGMAS